ncbi:scavenger receptor cysteine-rich type 1 protein M130-like [Pollicipes pollicipes]|uniref:scavenger receptor cysteine-rich type 1 protein M130-like n=1 Tax=Pollicipes pollicipes TaxID=41117 RepID=UPI0018855A20|nr:scavenger receptor cysteine-rich type 1 protein M130-like [Pollicipes pollicipes]
MGTEPVLGDYCTSTSVCMESITNGECTAGTCQCPSQHWVNSNVDCQPGVPLTGACSANIECQTITENSICGASGTCECDAGYFNYQNTQCLPVKALGDPCTMDHECGDETTKHCPSGSCACRPNYVSVEGVCKPAKNLGEACTVNEECTMTTANSICSGTCTCSAAHWEHSGTCRPSVAYGGSCTYDQDCSTHDARFACYSGTCSDYVCSPVSVGGYEYRLAGGTSACITGRVELRSPGGQWGHVCDDGWDDVDAGVFCRSLGFKYIMPLGFSAGTFACCSTHGYGGVLKFHMDDVACGGSENHLMACSYGGWDQHNCGSSEVSSVTCS